MKMRILYLTLTLCVFGGRIFSAETSTAASVPGKAAGEEPSGNWEVHLRPFMREKPEWYAGSEADLPVTGKSTSARLCARSPSGMQGPRPTFR